MSDVKKTGPACLTCRKTCRGCDRLRPACRRCIEKGIQCGGYPKKFRFTGAASRGKLKNLSSTPTIFEEEVPTRRKRRTRNQRQHRNQSVPAPESPISAVSPNLETVLLGNRVESLLAYYDKVICPHQIAMIHDGIENPYRKYILPLAYEHLAPLYAILGLAACHQGVQENDHEMRDNEAIRYQSLAIRNLMKLLEEESHQGLSATEYEALLATIQLLVLHDICESGVSKHVAHVSGSSAVSSRLLQYGKISPMNDRTVFFVGNLAWLDVLRAFAGTDRLCFSWDLLQAVAEASNEHFEQVNGIPRAMFLIMGDVLWHARRHSTQEISDTEFVGKLYDAQKVLKETDFTEEQRYPNDDKGWTYVAEAFRHACILHVLRLLDPKRPSHDVQIQNHVAGVLESTAMINDDSPLIELLIMPLFIAGTDTQLRHSRHYVISRIDVIWGRSGMANSTPKSLLLKVWDARDSRKSDDEHYISWTEFVSLSFDSLAQTTPTNLCLPQRDTFGRP